MVELDRTLRPSNPDQSVETQVEDRRARIPPSLPGHEDLRQEIGRQHRPLRVEEVTRLIAENKPDQALGMIARLMTVADPRAVDAAMGTGFSRQSTTPATIQQVIDGYRQLLERN